MTVSNRVMIDNCPVGYLYREESDDANDSGWRIFAGDETQDYAEVSSNFALYNASTIVERAPQLRTLLGAPYPIAFERDANTGEFVEIDE
ncbi:DUF2185 domain-containing protein [Massilia soli]|uniref:DUF2185 domain-containing protein n=1 Tax=Massilia soli TaxID=2792854 RepID=A0ABS7SVY2_9BURK|nr:DUF2185 domain-containing protein [Massilia soli]